MLRHTFFVLAAIILLTSLPVWCGDEIEAAGVPVMREVVPSTATPGTVVLVNGEHLDRLHVAEVYITRGSLDTKVNVTAQSNTVLKFKVPDGTEPGRYGITVLTATKVPMLLDQPVSADPSRAKALRRLKARPTRSGSGVGTNATGWCSRRP
jgi:hypothetical protein